MDKKERIFDNQLDKLSDQELKELNFRAGRDSALGYIFNQAADILFRRALRYVDKARGIARHEMKRKETRQMQLIEQVLKNFDISSIKIDSAICEVDGVEGYDRNRRNAFEFVRLLQLYWDRVRDAESAKKVNDLLMSLPSHNQFDEDELNIKMK